MGLVVLIGEFCEGLRNLGDIIRLLVAMRTRNLVGRRGLGITGRTYVLLGVSQEQNSAKFGSSKSDTYSAGACSMITAPCPWCPS